MTKAKRAKKGREPAKAIINNHADLLDALAAAVEAMQKSENPLRVWMIQDTDLIQVEIADAERIATRTATGP